MRVEKIALNFCGRKLHRFVLHPDETCRGTLVFFHGQGDYIDRYPPLLELFANAGIRCILTDLPGHGRSDGRRGAVPGPAFIDDLLNQSLEGQQSPHLIAGHSMGGLMALRFLLNRPEQFVAGWVSSPLLDPMRQATPWMRKLLPIIADLLPWMTVGTGVRDEDCASDQTGSELAINEALHHSRISIAWGKDLRDVAAEVAEQFPKLPTAMPLLFTQGTLDPICPASIFRDRIAKLPPNEVTYREIAEARHEPFNGPTGDGFREILGAWISTENNLAKVLR